MRETGANPVLSRNCKPDESPICHCFKAGRRAGRKMV